MPPKFTPLTSEKNQAPDIKALFDSLNRELFKDRIPKNFPVFWCHRLRTTAGEVKYKLGESREIIQIRLSYKLFESNGFNPEHIRNTMIHEMVHAYLYHYFRVTGHGPQFQNMMNRLVGYKEDHTYHMYDTSQVQNKRRNKVAIYCPGCKGIIGFRKNMSKRALYHRACGTKVSLYRVPYDSNPNSLFDLIKIANK